MQSSIQQQKNSKRLRVLKRFKATFDIRVDDDSNNITSMFKTNPLPVRMGSKHVVTSYLIVYYRDDLFDNVVINNDVVIIFDYKPR